MPDEEKKAIKVVNKRTERLIEELKIEEEDLIDEPKIAYLITQIEANKTLVNLIEKQSKEIEKLKEDKYGLEEEVQIQAKQLIEIDGNYISKEESEQRERKAYIKGTNDADELCNKKWKDKIKAKTEEVHYKMIGHQDLREAVKQVLNSLLEKEN